MSSWAAVGVPGDKGAPSGVQLIIQALNDDFTAM
jgi:hypothetical protein